MSYILEALRKMEKQARRDSMAESSWVDDLAIPSDDEKIVGKRTSKLLVAVCIFFGTSGILTGLLFYEGNQPLEKNQPSKLQSKSVVDSPKSVPPKAPENLNKIPGYVSTAPIKGVTLSELRSKLHVEDKEANKENLRINSTPPQVSKLKKVIDLTNSYKLTSTGEINNRKYATIERNNYHIGDDFKGMTITDIDKDRVRLKGKQSEQSYVIIFRYKNLQ